MARSCCPAAAAKTNRQRNATCCGVPWAANLRLNNPTQFTTFVGNTQGFRPFTNFGNISFVNNTGHSTNHSGTVKVEKRCSRGLTLLAFYTYAKSIDNEGANSSLIDGRLFRGRSSFDQTHRFVSNFSYALPFGKGRHWMSNANRLMDSFFGGWNFVWTCQIISGTPLTFGFADSPYNYMPGVVAQIGGRPNMTQRPKLRDGWTDLGGDRFNTANQNSVWTPESLSHMSYPAAYTMGNSGKNIVDSQRIIAASVSMSKEVQILERRGCRPGIHQCAHLNSPGAAFVLDGKPFSLQDGLGNGCIRVRQGTKDHQEPGTARQL